MEKAIAPAQHSGLGILTRPPARRHSMRKALLSLPAAADSVDFILHDAIGPE
jgi:hypothetical protein